MKLNFPVATGLFRFYFDGFRNMPPWGKKVWVIILIKFFILFAILKLFLFQDFLKKNFENEKQRSEYVLEKLTNPNIPDD